MRYYGKIHSILPIFRVKSVKIYTGQKNVKLVFAKKSLHISILVQTAVYYKFVQIFGNTLQVSSVFKFKQNTKSGRAPSQEVPLDPPSPRFNLTELDKAEEKEWMNGTFRLSFLLSFRSLFCESMNDLV